MADPYEKLRAQIRAGRELLNLKQADLAESLGVSLSKISRAESGETKSGDILLDLKGGLERKGIRFTQSGVEIVENYIEVLEGEGCYLRMLDDALARLKKLENREFLVMFSSDKVSPIEVNVRYKLMLKSGISFRKLISENDNYIMGRLEWYRTIPAKYFTNVVTAIYGNRVAQTSGGTTRVVIHRDPLYAERERQIFNYLWDMGGVPKETVADRKYEKG